MLIHFHYYIVLISNHSGYPTLEVDIFLNLPLNYTSTLCRLSQALSDIVDESIKIITSLSVLKHITECLCLKSLSKTIRLFQENVRGIILFISSCSKAYFTLNMLSSCRTSYLEVQLCFTGLGRVLWKQECKIIAA